MSLRQGVISESGVVQIRGRVVQESGKLAFGAAQLAGLSVAKRQILTSSIIRSGQRRPQTARSQPVGVLKNRAARND